MRWQATYHLGNDVRAAKTQEGAVRRERVPEHVEEGPAGCGGDGHRAPAGGRPRRAGRGVEGIEV